MRWALGISYNGRQYHGWQRQGSPEVITVQGQLEKVLSTVADHPVSVHCAGRTDAGVHGCGQIVHFECQNERPAKAWVMGGNAQLPDDIAVDWAVEVADDFHARFSALSRTYRYFILNGTTRSPLLPGAITFIREPLDEGLMHEAAQLLLGERDFSSFRGSGCQSNTPMRFVESITVERRGELLMVEITANAFLLHMVRNIVGSLLTVGRGQQPISWIGELMEARDRTLASPTAPPDGLYLVKVSYPDSCGLPEVTAGPFWWSSGSQA